MYETKNLYNYPYPKEVDVRGVIYESETHSGAFRYAEDHLMDLGIPIWAPLDGRVVNVVDWNRKFGSGPENSPYLNYITIEHQGGEYSQVAHLEKGSAKVRPGDLVREGQIIAMTGNSGRMTEPHLHWLVFKVIEGKDGFESLKIRYKKENAMT